MKTHWTHNPVVFAGLAIALYVVLAYIYALVKPVWCDEWWAMVPAYNLIHHGYLGMGEMWRDGGIACAVDRYHMYWYPPLQSLSLAVWFKVFGYGLISARMHTVMWGIVLLCGVFLIGKRFANGNVGAWAVLITALDYTMLGASDARADVMCAALGVWTLILGSVWFGVAACLVHPFGIFYTITLSALRKNLGYVIIIPMITLAIWSAYILQTPNVWWASMLGQWTTHTAQLEYALGFGVYMAYGDGWRLVLLGVYVACSAIIALRERSIALCLALLVLPAFFTTRSGYYFPHAVPWMALCVAVQMKKYPWLGAITVLQLVFAITTLVPFWTWNSVFKLR